MRDAPKGWPRISSAVFYDDAAQAIAWLGDAFGFSVRIKVEGEGGRIVHSELELADGLIMVGDTRSPERPDATHRRSPRAIGGANTQSLCVYIDDADAHCAHARAAGAKILAEPKNTDHGAEYWEDRAYEAEDLEGHRWWFVQRIRG